VIEIEIAPAESEEQPQQEPVRDSDAADRKTAATKAWQAGVAPYVGADVPRSLFQLISTLTLLAVAWGGVYWLFGHSVWLALALLVPAAGLFLRSFIIMHDAVHGSFLPWRRVNDIVGHMLGVLTFTPFGQWRRDHALHHASSGDLERRGHGDIDTWTVREYWSKTPRQRRIYRVARYPAVLLIGGPLYLLITQRFRARSKATGARQAESMWVTNVGIILFDAFLFLVMGWTGLLIHFVTYFIAAAAGVWLFYVQHQFEDAYWEPHKEWDYATAALEGSSYLRLPAVLHWFTGNIGFHHIHHLAPRIPNYRLQHCHTNNPEFQRAPVITIRTGVAAMRLALWDEDRGRMIRIDQALPPADPNQPGER
jgi:omega-6 fatty acid desaturase (delta-12 desaturase)